MANLLLEGIDGLSKRIETEDDPFSSKGISPIERLRFQILRAELEKRLADVRTKEKLALAALRVQLGLKHNEIINPASRNLPVLQSPLHPLDDYVDYALEERSDARLVEAGLKAKRLEYELERKKALPNLGVGGFFDVGRTIGKVTGVQAADDFNHPFVFTRGGIGLQLSGKFDWHGNRARVRRKRSELYRVKLQEALAKEGIGLEVRQAYMEAQSAMDQVKRTRESSEAARRMLFLSKSNMDIGVGSAREFAEALTFLLQTKGAYFEAVFAWDNSISNLNEKIGDVPYDINGA